MILADYRRNAGYETQLEFANKLGVSRDVVVKWETGVAYPRAPQIPDIAKMLHITSDEVINSITKARKGTA